MTPPPAHPPFTSAAQPKRSGIRGCLGGLGSWCDDHGRQAEQIPLDGYVPVPLGASGAAAAVEIDLQPADEAAYRAVCARAAGRVDVNRRPRAVLVKTA